MVWRNLIHYGNTAWRLGNPHNSAQQISAAALHQGLRVVYVNPVIGPRNARIRRGLAILTPGIEQTDQEMDRMRRSWGFTPRDTAVMISYATSSALELARWARRSGFPIIYRHVDWFLEQPGSRYSAAAAEQISRWADQVFVSHPDLRHCLPGGRGIFLRNGVCSRTFSPFRTPGEAPGDLRRGQITLGFWGQFWGNRVDWPLVERLARRRPDWQWNFIGSLAELGGQPAMPANVHFLGYRHPRQLARYGPHFDCGIVPYRHDFELARTSNPIKVLEYLAGMRSVVTPYNRSLEGYPGVFSYHTPEQAEEAILQASQTKLDPLRVAPFVLENNWERKLQQLLEQLPLTASG